MRDTLTEEQLNSRYQLVEKLLKLFRFERAVHLLLTALSFIVLLAAIGLMLYAKQVNATELSLVFGSSGLVGYTGGNLLRMWNQAIKIIVEGKI